MSLGGNFMCNEAHDTCISFFNYFSMRIDGHVSLQKINKEEKEWEGKK